MIQFKPNIKRARWLPLSAGRSHRHNEWHLFGWMLVFSNGSWREGETVGTCEELVSVLRVRQSKLDAPRVLDACEEAGVAIHAEDGMLKIRGTLTDDLRDDLKRCKPDVLKILADVPAWDIVEAVELETRIRTGHNAIRPYLHPTTDDEFSIAGRAVCGDLLASVASAIAIRRIDHLRRRVDWILGWMATLEPRLHELRRDYSLNSRPPHLTHFSGKPTKGMLNRWNRDERSRQLEKQRRFAEAADVMSEPEDE